MKVYISIMVLTFCVALFLMVTPGQMAAIALWVVGVLFGVLFLGWLMVEMSDLIPDSSNKRDNRRHRPRWHYRKHWFYVANDERKGVRK